MPTLTHKVTGLSSIVSEETLKKLTESGKIHTYKVEKDTPPEIPKEIKKLSADKQKTAESDKHGASTTIDGASGGNAGTSE